MKPIIRIHDLATGEVIDREMTDEEFAAHQAELEKINAPLELDEPNEL